jgi:hypothetical protein
MARRGVGPGWAGIFEVETFFPAPLGVSGGGGAWTGAVGGEADTGAQGVQ